MVIRRHQSCGATCTFEWIGERGFARLLRLWRRGVLYSELIWHLKISSSLNHHYNRRPSLWDGQFFVGRNKIINDCTIIIIRKNQWCFCVSKSSDYWIKVFALMYDMTLVQERAITHLPSGNHIVPIIQNPSAVTWLSVAMVTLKLTLQFLSDWIEQEWVMTMKWNQASNLCTLKP